MTTLLGLFLILMLIVIVIGSIQGNRQVIIIGMIGLGVLVVVAAFLLVVGIPNI